MDHEQIDAIAHQAGALPEALTDIRARVQAHFPEADVSPQAVERWLTQVLKPQADHLFAQTQEAWTQLGLTKQEFDQLPASWRLAQAHQLTPPVARPHPNRPVPKDAPADVQAQWQDLSLTERLTAYRQWRDSQG